MPITKSAKQSIKKNSRNRKPNLRRMTVFKKTKKEFLKLIENGKIDEAKKMESQLYKILDKAAKTNLMKKNKTSREKSRLTKKLKKEKK